MEQGVLARVTGEHLSQQHLLARLQNFKLNRRVGRCRQIYVVLASKSNYKVTAAFSSFAQAQWQRRKAATVQRGLLTCRIQVSTSMLCRRTYEFVHPPKSILSRNTLTRKLPALSFRTLNLTDIALAQV